MLLGKDLCEPKRIQKRELTKFTRFFAIFFFLFPKTSNQTPAELLRAAMLKANIMPQKGYRYVTAPTIHPDVKEAFNRTHGHKRGPPPGFIPRMLHTNQARRNATLALNRLNRPNAYA